MRISLVHEDGSEEAISSEVRRGAGGPVAKPKRSVADVPSSETTARRTADPLAELKIKQADLYRQRSKASNDLVRLGEQVSVAQRKPVVEEILRLQDEYNTLAEQKRHFEEDGTLPQAPRPKSLPTAGLPHQKHELVRKRTNLASQISKAKANIKKYQHNPAKLLHYQQKETQLKALLAEVDGRLTR